MDRLIRTDIIDGVGVITLNRPDAFNALNIAFARELSASVHAVTEDPAVRAILLKASGKHFCAGGDVKWFAGLGQGLGAGLDELIGILNPVAERLMNCPLPVVTAAKGIAAGAGVGFALSGDIVYAGESFKMLSSYSAIGLTPDLGAAYCLVRRVGLSRAKEFFFRNLPLDAKKCMEWGVISAVFPDEAVDDEAFRLASDLAKGPTLALTFTKKLVDKSLYRELDEQLALEREFMSRCGRSDDGMEGVAAFVEKRNPKFTGK